MVYFEDVETGTEIEIGRHTPSKEEIVGFARQWDPQPFHMDEEAARASVFGGLSASSCHTYAISSLIHSRSPHKVRAAAMLGMQVRFPSPVRPDEEITLFELPLEKRISRSRRNVGIVRSRTRLCNARGEDVMIMETSFLVERRPRASETDVAG